MLRRKQTRLFSLALISCILSANVSLAQNDPSDVVSDQLTSDGSAIVVEAFYGPGGILSSADDANFTSTSYLVIDHNDGSTPVAYGYRYNDNTNSTSETLLTDVILFAKFSSFTFDGVTSNFINGIGYNTDGDADFGDLSDGTTSEGFVAADGYLDAPSAIPPATSIDVDDSYQEGGGSASWVFFDIAGNPFIADTPQWGGPAPEGASTTPLANGSFNGFYYDFDFAAVPLDLEGSPGANAFGDLGPGVPETVAIPEPTGLMLLLGGGFMIGFRRRRCQNLPAKS